MGFVQCCKFVRRLLNNELTQQTQRSKVSNIPQVLHVNSRSCAGRPPQAQQHYNRQVEHWVFI